MGNNYFSIFQCWKQQNKYCCRNYFHFPLCFSLCFSAKRNTPHNTYFLFSFIMLLALLFESNFSWGQTYTYTTSGTFTVPAGITSVNVQAWGAGGAGGGAYYFIWGGETAGGGGAGGSYTSQNATGLTAGSVITVTVGTGGTGVNSADGGAGGASSFGSYVTAFGGNGGTVSGTGASATIGTTYNGGAGSNKDVSNNSGAGGGGAGSSGSGGNASGTTGGTGGAGGGGTGANGRTNNGDGNNATSLSAGGGGARQTSGIAFLTGGNGYRGQVIVNWTCPTYSLTSVTGLSICAPATSTTITLNGNSSNLPTGTYTVTYSRNSTTGLTATMTVSTAGTGSFTAMGLNTNGTYTITITNLSSGGTPAATCSNSISTNNSVTVIRAAAAPATPGAITGPVTVCPSVSGINYSISSVTNASNYNWTVPTGWTINSGQGTISISVTSGTSGQNGNVSVRAENGCGNSSYRDLAVTVRPVFTAGTIESTGQTICYAGTPSQIGSATDASGGDNLITYQWRSSADGYTNPIGGAASSTYTPPAGLTATTSYQRYANDGTCNTSPTVSTGTWTVTVRDNFTSGAIETTGQTICYAGTPSQIGSATDASGGDNSISYQWSSSADGYTNPIGGAASSTYTPPAGLTSTTSYQRYANDGTCNTSPTVSTGTWTVTVRDNFTSGAIETTGQTICYAGTPSLIGSTTDASGGDNSITYQWRSSADGYTNPISGAASSTYTPPAGLTSTTSYQRYANDDTCNTSPTLSSGTWTVTVRDNFTSGAIETTGQTICYAGTPSQIGSATDASGGDNSISYQWRSSADGYTNPIGGAASSTYTPPAGLTSTTSYQRYANDGTCNTSPTVSSGTWTVTVRDNFTSGAIETTGQTICYNSDPSVISSSTPASGGDNSITYKWQSSPDGSTWTDIASSNSATYDPSNLTATTHFQRLAKDGTCAVFTASTGEWIVTVNPLPTITLANTGATACLESGIPGSLEISSTTNSPNQYSIVFDLEAIDEGFENVPYSDIYTDVIEITVPDEAALDTYYGSLTVRNSNGCVSSSTQISITVISTGATVSTVNNEDICPDLNNNGFTNVDFRIDNPTLTDSWQFEYSVSEGNLISLTGNSETPTEVNSSTVDAKDNTIVYISFQVENKPGEELTVELEIISVTDDITSCQKLYPEHNNNATQIIKEMPVIGPFN